MGRIRLSRHQATEEETEAAYRGGAIVSQTAEEAAIEKLKGASGTRLPEGYQSAADHTGEHTPKPAPSLIEGVLRQGHKMMITAASKQGKSWLATDLAWAIATGGKLWDRYRCKRGRVIYVNAELDEADFWNRVDRVAVARDIPEGEERKLFTAYHTRGKVMEMDVLVKNIIKAWKGKRVAAVIIDPIYKYETGDENTLAMVRTLMGEIDRLANELRCAVIYVHHHAKGAAGSRAAMDRAAGSGGFARDYDAHLDLTQKDGTAETAYLRNKYGEGARAYQAEFTLRSYKEPAPFTVVWQWPLFVPVEDKRLTALPLVGSARANSQKGGRATKEQADRRKARENEIMAEAMARCKAEGKPCTRANVHPIYCALAEEAGEDSPKPGTFKSWTRKGSAKGKRLAYHVEEENGNVLVPDTPGGDTA